MGKKKEPEKRGRRKVRKSRDRMGNRVALIGVTVVVFCLGVVVHVKGESMKKKDLDYQAREEVLLRQVEKEQKRAQELEEYRIYVQTKEYIEEVAKQKLGLVNPDEILLKPAPK